MTAVLRKFWPPLLASLLLIVFYYPYLNLPFINDEVMTFLLPTLKLAAHGELLLPWNFTPVHFFGHPPLYYILHAAILSIFPASIVTLRAFAVFYTILTLFTVFQIGSLRSPRWGQLAVLIFMSHFLFLQMGNLFLADTFFTLLFVLFIWAILKEKIVLGVVLGLCMILTRESSLIVFFAFSAQGLLDYKTKKSTQKLTVGLILFGLQCLWFLSLWLTQGSATPIYYPEGFILKWDFVSTTFASLVKRIYIDSWWGLLFLILGQLFYFDFRLKQTHLWRDHLFLLIIPLCSLIALSFVTVSYSHYQYFALTSLGLYFVATCRPTPSTQAFLLILLTVVFIRNTWLGIRNANNFRLSTEGPEVTRIYQCAGYLASLNLIGAKGVAIPHDILKIANHYQTLVSMKWQESDLELITLFPRAAFQKNSHFDIFVYLRREHHLRHAESEAYLERVRSDKKFERVTGEHEAIGCFISKRVAP